MQNPLYPDHSKAFQKENFDLEAISTPLIDVLRDIPDHVQIKLIAWSVGLEIHLFFLFLICFAPSWRYYYQRFYRWLL